MKQPGLDNRHRDANGEISKKHGNTTIGMPRHTYGEGFAPGVHGNAKLATVLKELDEPSLTQVVKDLQKEAK